MKRIIKYSAVLATVACLSLALSCSGGRKKAEDRPAVEKPEGRPGRTPGQDGREGRDRKQWEQKFKSERIAFLTDAIGLTPEEAQAFWPVYNQADKERGESFRAMQASYNALKEAVDNGKSEEETAPLLEKYVQAQKAVQQINEKYFPQYKQILGIEKTARLYMGEEAFRRSQIRRMNSGRRDRN